MIFFAATPFQFTLQRRHWCPLSPTPTNPSRTCRKDRPYRESFLSDRCRLPPRPVCKTRFRARFLQIFAFLLKTFLCLFIFSAHLQSLTLEEKDEICPRCIHTPHGKAGFHYEMLQLNMNKNIFYTYLCPQARMQL